MSDLGNKEIRFYNMNMGDRIKELRLQNEMTQEELGKKGERSHGR